MRVHIQTYGCSNNMAESQTMEKLLTGNGFSVSGFDSADLVIVNTCSVKSVTENKILHRLRDIHNNYPEKRLIVAGCMPESEYEIIKEVVPNASLLSTHHIDEVVGVANSVANGEYMEVLGKSRLDKAILPRQRANPAIEIVPVASGCKSFCTFCATKIAKGELFSFPAESIVGAVRQGIASSVREFWLTSQDNGCYGFDRSTNLAELVQKITREVEGNYMLRIGMMNPEHLAGFLPHLIDAYRNEKVFKFLHLPVQSGSDRVLEKMKRGHTIEDFRKIVSEFRKEFPRITIWTDIIAGFPGETEEDFDASMRLVKSMEFDFVNVSAYGNRPKTAASRMKQTPTQIKKERTRKMSALVRKLSERSNQQWIGWRGEAIVDEYNQRKYTWIARNYAYKPVVLEGNFSFGDRIYVKINRASSNALFGVPATAERIALNQT